MRKPTLGSLSISMTSHRTTFEPSLEHGRSNVDLISVTASGCYLTLFVIFDPILSADKGQPVSISPFIKKERVKSASQADNK